ncbi:Putative glycosyltransferase EpsE [Stieleria neptunia]|uniref:Glycosyltransferase EpsE n=2 Tax=Stieleria neptunia TaxID=2527979 RepID=A0A518HQM6_9BACT|nr:Putative glycosyltransferase EpsE [Stieleria neptunia]
MGCHNGGPAVADTVRSIQGQTLSSWELVIVDDGSDDATATLLDELAEDDSRIRVIRQEQAGLTNALIAGCRATNAEYIARQDVGDRSLPERLETQARFLDDHRDVVVVGSGIQWIGPRGEMLGNWVRNQNAEEITSELAENGTGFVHPSVMFRREAYERAGGYRTQFRFAQDHDLWYRMAEIGKLDSCQEILFEYRIDIAGISPENRNRQHRLGEIARKCYFARKKSQSEQALLDEAQQVSWDAIPANKDSRRRAIGQAAYFVGSQLYAKRDRRCKQYLAMALRKGAMPVRAMIKYGLATLLRFPVGPSREAEDILATTDDVSSAASR